MTKSKQRTRQVRYTEQARDAFPKNIQKFIESLLKTVKNLLAKKVTLNKA